MPSPTHYEGDGIGVAMPLGCGLLHRMLLVCHWRADSKRSSASGSERPSIARGIDVDLCSDDLDEVLQLDRLYGQQFSPHARVTWGRRGGSSLRGQGGVTCIEEAQVDDSLHAFAEARLIYNVSKRFHCSLASQPLTILISHHSFLAYTISLFPLVERHTTLFDHSIMVPMLHSAYRWPHPSPSSLQQPPISHLPPILSLLLPLPPSPFFPSPAASIATCTMLPASTGAISHCHLCPSTATSPATAAATHLLLQHMQSLSLLLLPSSPLAPTVSLPLPLLSPTPTPLLHLLDAVISSPFSQPHDLLLQSFPCASIGDDVVAPPFQPSSSQTHLC
ncbi:hypothetical protein B296_00012805 [Ensete ventricosum]|uniref:Uncharacterized protein n=1 Tax=Ensete ventricosum TaxID=4639 RepID=A0A427AJK5_ENSVE|nr:hypothetical protein B296_00012805 [Ensete ventricosum]